MGSVEQGLAGLRHAAAMRVDGVADWAALEQAVIGGLHRHQARAQARRQLAWTGALALVVGLAGGVAQQPWHAFGPRHEPARLVSPLALPAQAPSVVLMGAG